MKLTLAKASSKSSARPIATPNIKQSPNKPKQQIRMSRWWRKNYKP